MLKKRGIIALLLVILFFITVIFLCRPSGKVLKAKTIIGEKIVLYLWNDEIESALEYQKKGDYGRAMIHLIKAQHFDDKYDIQEEGITDLSVYYLVLSLKDKNDVISLVKLLEISIDQVFDFETTLRELEGWYNYEVTDNRNMYTDQIYNNRNYRIDILNKWKLFIRNNNDKTKPK